MKILLTIIYSLTFLICNAQNSDKKIKKVKDDYFINFYTINKSNKQKDGEYFKIKRKSNDTLIFGYYKDDKKVGIWKFKSLNKKDYIIYNYDSLSVTFLSKTIKNIDTFYIKKDSSYILSKIDSPPIYLGYENEIKELLSDNTVISMDIFDKGIF